MNTDTAFFPHMPAPECDETITAALKACAGCHGGGNDDNDARHAQDADEAPGYDTWFREQVALGRLAAARGELIPHAALAG